MARVAQEIEPVSNAGGVTPLWSRNGHELFYRTEDQRIMVANYAVKGESFVADKPRVWFGKQLANVGLTGNFDLATDGKRVVALMPVESPEPLETQSHVKIATNFFDGSGGAWRRKANNYASLCRHATWPNEILSPIGTGVMDEVH